MRGKVNRVGVMRFIAGILLAILSVYYVNSTMFSHTHTIDGATITHSHFHSNSHGNQDGSNDDGGHTKAELTLIHHLNNITTIKVDVVSVAKPSAEQCHSAYIPTSIRIFAPAIFAQSSPRAPPRFFC